MKKTFAAFATLISAVLMASPLVSVSALTLNVENPYLSSVTDTFSNIRRPDTSKPWDYWWVTLNSVSPAQGRVENQTCAGGVNNNSNCVIAMEQGDTDFARFVERPGKPEGAFYFAQMTDVKDSQGPSTQSRWEPAVNQPVVLTMRARFSANYLADGSNATGSAGFGFWNQPTIPLDAAPYVTYYKAPQALWFTYTTNKTFGGALFTGFTANYVDQNAAFLPFYTELPSVNLQNWNLYSLIWSTNSTGQQHVKFLINGQKVAEYDLIAPLPAMSLISWVDSSLITLDGQVHSDPPVTEQSMDVDFINVTQVRL